MNEYQKQFDLFCKVFCYGAALYWFLGLLKYLPDDLSNRLVEMLLGKIGL